MGESFPLGFRPFRAGKYLFRPKLMRSLVAYGHCLLGLLQDQTGVRLAVVQVAKESIGPCIDSCAIKSMRPNAKKGRANQRGEQMELRFHACCANLADKALDPLHQQRPDKAMRRVAAFVSLLRSRMA